jgi:thymidylate synthase
MNMFALVHLQKKIAARISELIKREVKLGRYVDFSDSYHIYGKNLKEFEGRFMKAMQERSFQQRTMRYCDVREMMDEAIPDIMRKVADVSARTV